MEQCPSCGGYKVGHDSYTPHKHGTLLGSVAYAVTAGFLLITVVGIPFLYALVIWNDKRVAREDDECPYRRCSICGYRWVKGRDRTPIAQAPAVAGQPARQCTTCKAQLPADAAFCLRCGSPQASSTTANLPAVAAPWAPTLAALPPTALPKFRGADTTVIDGGRCEICKISMTEMDAPFVGSPTWRFRAIVSGPKKRYTLAESPPFKLRSRQEAGLQMPEPGDPVREHFLALLAQIDPDEWEVIPQGDDWYNLNFRRCPK